MPSSAPRRRRAPPRIEARAEAARARSGDQGPDQGADPRLDPREDQAPTPRAGDLFEHFGVTTEVDRGQPAPIVDGLACPRCSWLLTKPVVEPCPLCGYE